MKKELKSVWTEIRGNPNSLMYIELCVYKSPKIYDDVLAKINEEIRNPVDNDIRIEIVQPMSYKIKFK